jgi:hypothetical protein
MQKLFDCLVYVFAHHKLNSIWGNLLFYIDVHLLVMSIVGKCLSDIIYAQVVSLMTNVDGVQGIRHFYHFFIVQLNCLPYLLYK